MAEHIEIIETSKGKKQIKIKPVQEKASTEALNVLNGCLKDDDVCIYNGHARAGGGPDTFFPILQKPSLETDVDYNSPTYKSQEKIKSIGKILNNRNSPPNKTNVENPEPLGGLFILACKSKPLFRGILKVTQNKKTLFGLLPDLGATADDPHSILALLNGYSAGLCPKSIMNSINAGLSFTSSRIEIENIPTN